MNEPPAPAADSPGATHNARLGFLLFLVYFIIYATFVALCVFDLDLMGRPLLGMNVAVCYGFGLILSAFVLAVIYLVLSRDD